MGHARSKTAQPSLVTRPTTSLHAKHLSDVAGEEVGIELGAGEVLLPLSAGHMRIRLQICFEVKDWAIHDCTSAQTLESMMALHTSRAGPAGKAEQANCKPWQPSLLIKATISSQAKHFKSETGATVGSADGEAVTDGVTDGVAKGVEGGTEGDEGVNDGATDGVTDGVTKGVLVLGAKVGSGE